MELAVIHKLSVKDRTFLIAFVGSVSAQIISLAVVFVVVVAALIGISLPITLGVVAGCFSLVTAIATAICAIILWMFKKSRLAIRA